MELRNTVDLMLSKDYRERFKAEYHQTKIRYKNLHQMCVKYEAGVLLFEPTCSLELLKQQKAAMGQYLYYLEMRAELEHIDLEACDKCCCCEEQGEADGLCEDTENHTEAPCCEAGCPEPQEASPFVLNFSTALDHVKGGRKAWRYGWSSFIILVDDVEFHTNADLHGFDGQPVTVNPAIAQWTGLTVTPGWVPTQEDLLANDWAVFD